MKQHKYSKIISVALIPGGIVIAVTWGLLGIENESFVGLSIVAWMCGLYRLDKYLQKKYEREVKLEN